MGVDILKKKREEKRGVTTHTHNLAMDLRGRPTPRSVNSRSSLVAARFTHTSSLHGGPRVTLMRRSSSTFGGSGRLGYSRQFFGRFTGQSTPFLFSFRFSSGVVLSCDSTRIPYIHLYSFTPHNAWPKYERIHRFASVGVCGMELSMDTKEIAGPTMAMEQRSGVDPERNATLGREYKFVGGPMVASQQPPDINKHFIRIGSMFAVHRWVANPNQVHK
jgi:hypothetical protein